MDWRTQIKPYIVTIIVYFLHVLSVKRLSACYAATRLHKQRKLNVFVHIRDSLEVSLTSGVSARGRPLAKSMNQKKLLIIAHKITSKNSKHN